MTLRHYAKPLAIFDIDGTLVDSRASIFKAAKEAARDLGLPEPEYDRVRQIVGLSLSDAMRALEPSLAEAELAEFVAAFQASFRRMFDAGHEEPLYDGAMEMLWRLKDDGWRLSLATGQNRRGISRNLARPGWAELFSSSHCASDGPGKPDPAMLLEGCRRLSVSADSTVYVGDMTVDVEAGKAAGIPVWLVHIGLAGNDDPRAAGPARVLGDFAEILTWV